MQDRIELIRQSRIEVMAHALGLRSVDDANRPLKSMRHQDLQAPFLGAHGQAEARDPDLMEERLVALRQRGAHALALGGLIPVRGRRNRALISAEADRDRLLTVALA